MSLHVRSRGGFLLPALALLLALAIGAPADAAVHPKRCKAHERLTAKDRHRDTDRDGVPNIIDRDVDGDGIPNRRDRDVDGDGTPNTRDADIDGDGIPNRRDADLDGDCMTNGRDLDSDGDRRRDERDVTAFGPQLKAKRAQAVVSRRVPASFFGMVANEAMAFSGEAQDAVLAQLRATGAGTLRQKFDWAAIERSPGVYSWGATDALMLAAGRAGIQVLPILFNAPAWDSAAPDANGAAPPRDNATMAAFADAAVRRYGPNGSLWAQHPAAPAAPIRAWQVWNEPNFKAFWSTGPDPAAYAAMLRTVGDAIHAADPGAEVVAAGLPESYSGMSVTDFLDGMYQAGAKGAFDTLAVHPYARSADETIWILQQARRALDRHGDGGVGIWATELGWATGGPAAPYRVREVDQARLMTWTLDALVAERDRLRLRGVVYYFWQDCAPWQGGKDFWGLHTGLHRIDGSAKPALGAFVNGTRALTAGA